MNVKNNIMRKLLLSFSFLLICFLANAGKNVKGYYINNKGDTVNCTFSISTELLSSNSNYIEEQFKIKIILSENKTIILIPDTVKALVFMDGKKMKFVTLENNFGLPR